MPAPIDTSRNSSLLTLILAGVAAIIGLAIVVWVAGVLAHLLGLLIQVAVAAAVAAYVWHRVGRRMSRHDGQ